MRGYFVFDSPEVKAILKDYVRRKYRVVEDRGDFVVRKVGRILRLEYALQDLVDWWDLNVRVGELEGTIKGGTYYRMVFKNLLEFSEFRKVLESTGMDWDIKVSRVYYVPLVEYADSESLRRSFSKNVWKNVRNTRNRLRRRYGSIEVSPGDPLKEYGWTVKMIADRHPHGPFSDPDFTEAMGEVVRVMSNMGMLKVWVLRGGGRTLATNYVIESDGVALSYMAGYDPKAGDVYRFLIYHVITEYHRMGFREFNFMKGESPYKRQWTDRYYRLYRYEALNPSPLRRLLSVLRSHFG